MSDVRRMSGRQPVLRRREAGVCLHLTSLPGPFGIGEIGRHAAAFVDSMRKMQLSVWQFLPTGPTAFANSPYQPLSTFAGNELLIDVGNLIDLELLAAREARALADLPQDFIDYGRLIPLKSRLLRVAAGRFPAKASAAMKSACDDFIEQNDKLWLHDYATFRILKSQFGERSWPEWPPELVQREAASLQNFEMAHAGAIAQVKVLQFLFNRQWRELRDYAHAHGVRLFGDMPIYVALDSSDAWANKELLRIDDNGQPDCVAGVPPDYYSEDGQLWGNPLYAWDYHDAQRYRWWIERLRAAESALDIVRIDHFRGFEAYWAVPAGSATARLGAWEHGPGDALFDTVRAALGDPPIVAENLGVITPEVEALRERHGIPGMKVLQFELIDERFKLTDVPAGCVCYTGTHDNDTTAGWFEGGSDDIRTDAEIERNRQAALKIAVCKPQTIHAGLVRAAFSTDALLAIAPLQDYLGLGSEARLNTPGTSTGNWRWRADATQLSADACERVAGMVQASGRGS